MEKIKFSIIKGLKYKQANGSANERRLATNLLKELNKGAISESLAERICELTGRKYSSGSYVKDMLK